MFMHSIVDFILIDFSFERTMLGKSRMSRNPYSKLFVFKSQSFLLMIRIVHIMNQHFSKK